MYRIRGHGHRANVTQRPCSREGGRWGKGSSGRAAAANYLAAAISRQLPPPTANIKPYKSACVGDEREGEGLRGGGGAPAPTAPATYTTRTLPRGLCRGRKRTAPQAMRGGGGGGGACCSSTILSSRCQRLRMACSVRPGMRCAMRYHLCPISRTYRRGGPRCRREARPGGGCASHVCSQSRAAEEMRIASSPTSLGCTSAAPRLHLGCTPATPRLRPGYAPATSRLSLSPTR